MANEIKITYKNNSQDPSHPKVFFFNTDPNFSFNDLSDEVAWKVLPNVGTGTSAVLNYSSKTEEQGNKEE